MGGNYNARWLSTPDEDQLLITFSRKMREAVSTQLKDNAQAQYAMLQALGLQLIGPAVDKRDLLSLLYEMAYIPTEDITDNFGIDEQRLAEIRAADPISIVSCLECHDHLLEGDRRSFLQQLRVLRYLGRFETGERVKLKTICMLLCNTCSREHWYFCEEQLRAERLALQARSSELCSMSYSEYHLTREWKAKKKRALIRAGNKCQLCGRRDLPLSVHHNCYERLGNELLEDLIVLCRDCHKRHHDSLPEAA